MDVTNPRRILAVSLADSSQHLCRVVKDLTGIAPEPAGTTLAGTTHPLVLNTTYYKASVPIWLDLVSAPADWSASFLSPEAKEVLDVLGGVVVVFALPIRSQSPEGAAARELIEHVGRVVKEGLGGWAWDGVGLCLGVGEVDEVDEWDDCAAQWGLEFVQVRAAVSTARNELGETTGIPRALEALEANDWDQAGDDELDSDFGDFVTDLKQDTETPDSSTAKGADLDPESLDFGFDREDFAGLKKAIWSAGQDDDDDPASGVEANGHASKESSTDNDDRLDDDEIRKLEGMMRKLQGVRDTGVGMPEEQRKRMAAKAVQEVMKDL